MHRSISNDDESARKDGKANDICPQSAIIKTKSAEYRSTWYFDVQAILVVDQG